MSGTCRVHLLGFALVHGAAAEPMLPPAEAGHDPAARAARDTTRLPRVLSSPAARYPDGETEQHSVVLVVLVETDGSTSEVEPLAGREPFIAAAVAAVRRWRFAPARTQGVAVAARVRVVIDFAAPALASDAGRTAPISNIEPAGAASAEEPGSQTNEAQSPIEVLVEGERQPTAAESLSRAESRLVPGAFGDPFRAIEALPGVTPAVSSTPFFFVRGSPPGNVGYFLDDIPLPLLFHAGLGPAVVPASLLAGVDFYPGAAPARYGGFAGAVVAGKTSPPASELSGEAIARVVDAGAQVQVPFAAGSASALLGGRYAYSANYISEALDSSRYAYWDYQARLGYRFSDQEQLQLTSFGAYDFLEAEVDVFSERGGASLFDLQFHRLDARYDSELTPALNSTLAVTLGQDRTVGDGRNFGQARSRSLRARIEFDQQASESSQLNYGIEASTQRYDVDLPPAPMTAEQLARMRKALFDRSDRRFSSWLDTQLDQAHVTVTPGVRVDVYASGDQTQVGVDPRLAARFHVTDSVDIEHSLGIAHQPASFVIPLPGVQSGGLPGGLQRALQSSSGVEFDLGQAARAGFTVYQNVTFNQHDEFSLDRLGLSEGRFVGERSTGHSLGVEVLLKRPLTKRLGGFVSYTLSRTTLSYLNYGGPSGFDRRHVLNTALSYDLGSNWRAGARALFQTGGPGVIRRFDEPPPRLENFFRLDLRFEKVWQLTGGSRLAGVLEVLNATFARENVNTLCTEDIAQDGQGTEVTCYPRYFEPLTIPSLGVEWFF